MSFTSIAFIGFIILTAIIYFIVPKRVRWGVLLAASYAFYFLSSPKTFIFVLITTISTFLCGRYLGIVQQKYKDYLDGHREELDKDQKNS